MARLGGGGLRTGRGLRGSAGTGPVLLSYMCTVGEGGAALGEVGAATWEVAVGSIGSIRAGGTGGSRVP